MLSMTTLIRYINIKQKSKGSNMTKAVLMTIWPGRAGCRTADPLEHPECLLERVTTSTKDA